MRTILKPVPKGHHDEKKGFFGWFNRKFDATTHGYQNWVSRILHKGGRMMLAFLVLVILLAGCTCACRRRSCPRKTRLRGQQHRTATGATANRTVDVIEQVEKYFADVPAVANVIAVQGYSFNGNGLNAAIAFVTLKDFSERKERKDSAGAIAFKAFEKQLMGIHDARCSPWCRRPSPRWATPPASTSACRTAPRPVPTPSRRPRPS